MGVQVRLVANPADGAATALHVSVPGLGADQTGEHLQEGGLPGPVRAEDGEGATGLEPEGDAVEGADRGGTEGVGQAFSRQHRAARRARSGRTAGAHSRYAPDPGPA